jgi:AcrR family transcriptional regulator
MVMVYNDLTSWIYKGKRRNFPVPRTGLTAEQIKERAVQIAESKMRLLGPDRLRLTDVARDMGIAHSALYKHFPDKTALFDAVSEKWVQAMIDTLEKIAHQNQSPSKLIVDFFLTMHRAKVERIRKDPELYKAYELATSSSKKTYINDFIKRYHAQVLFLVKRAIEEKEFAPGSAEKYTSFLLDAACGFTAPPLVARFVHQDREPALKQTLKFAFKALSK